MHGEFLLVGLLTLAPAAGGAIDVGPNVHVSAARAQLSHLEVVIAADPNSPGRLLACSMFRDEGIHSAAYVSFDHGRTWSAPVYAPELFANDPTCVYCVDGTALFTAKTATRYPRKSSAWDAVYMRRSPDGGKTWEPAVRSFMCIDRPFTAVDHTDGPRRGRVYIAYNHRVYGEHGNERLDDWRNTMRLSTSLDGGKTFPLQYDRVLLDQSGGKTAMSLVGSVVVLSDGTVVVLHAHAVAGGRNPDTGKLRFERTWMQVFRSTYGGETVDPAIRIGDIETSYNIPNSRTTLGTMAVDATRGQFRDRLYAVWSDVRSGRSEIMLTVSADKGLTWLPPRVISDDQDGAGERGRRDHFMPTVAVNKDGVVGVMWYDRRDNPDNKGYYARFSASLDGGKSWLPSRRVSERPNAVPDASAERQPFSVTGGDTAGLTADSTGVFHALWIDNRTGIQQVWTAPVTVKRP